jgi:hypothetical protein
LFKKINDLLFLLMFKNEALNKYFIQTPELSLLEEGLISTYF